MKQARPDFFEPDAALLPDGSPLPVSQDQSEFNVIFVHRRLDDYGLSAPQFRVYCHLARRASNDGKAWPSIRSIAKVCRLNKKTVRSALRVLVEHHLVEPKQRDGATTLYCPPPAPRWPPPTQTGTAPCLARV